MNKMMNMPEIRLGIVAVSRDCFPASFSAGRRTAVCKACSAKGIDVYECPTTVESEKSSSKQVFMSLRSRAKRASIRRMR